MKKPSQAQLTEASLDKKYEEIILLAKEAEKRAEKRAASTINMIVDIFSGAITAIISVPVIAVAPPLAPFVSLIGDVGPSLFFMNKALKDAKKIGMDEKYIKKIKRYYGKDILAGATPVIGTFIDMLYKANHKTAKLFKKYREELEKR